MSNPYASVTVNSYNANPPTDNGAQTSNNRIDWAKFKTKIGDPLKTAIEADIVNTAAAFGKVIGLGATVISATDVTAVVGDQGKTFVFTATATFTLPDAAVVGSPFAVAVRNRSTGVLTIAVPATTPVQHVSGAASVELGPDDGGMIVCDGSDFEYIGAQASKSFATGTKCLFFQTAAPLGWTKDTSLDDASIKLVNGTVDADAGSIAFSSMFGQVTLLKANLPSYNLTVTDPGHTHPMGGFGAALTGGTTLYIGDTAGGGGSSKNTVANTTGISVSSGGSGTPLDFRLKHAKAIRAVKI